MKYIVKKAEAGQYKLLRDFLYLAIYIPEGEAQPPSDIVDLPEISKYVDGWGRPGDTGFIAESGGEAVGAAWARLFGSDCRGYGFVDVETPELSMSVKIEHRGKGLGTSLIETLLVALERSGFGAVSLSVDKRNRAKNLYDRFGFKVVDAGGNDFKMVKKLRQ